MMMKLASMDWKVISYPEFILWVNNKEPLKKAVFIYLYEYDTI